MNEFNNIKRSRVKYHFYIKTLNSNFKYIINLILFLIFKFIQKKKFKFLNKLKLKFLITAFFISLCYLFGKHFEVKRGENKLIIQLR